MNCPKCGHQQPDGLDECQRCSVIISKFLALQERENDPEEDYEAATFEEDPHGYAENYGQREYGYEDASEPVGEDRMEWSKYAFLYIIMGLAFIAFAGWEYNDLVAWEQEGDSRTMNVFLLGLYDWFGKWGVVAPFVLLGGFFVVGGIRGLANR